MQASVLDVPALKELLEVEPAPALVSVDTEKVFEEGHLPDSERNAVYEMGFVDRMRELVSDRERPVILYSVHGRSQASAFAAEKLLRAGYRRVYDFRGGVEAWREAGFTVVGKASGEVVDLAPDGRLELDADNSRLHWVGRNVASLHEGTVGLKSGWVELVAGILRAGELVVDLEQIECADLSGSELHEVLIKHLRDHDFFDVELHPEARIRLLEVRHEAEESPGRPNYYGTAELDLRGQTHSLRFGLAGGSNEPGHFSLQGPVSFDRTQWGAIYGSARFFARLAGHLVNDFIDLDLRLNFKRED